MYSGSLCGSTVGIAPYNCEIESLHGGKIFLEEKRRKNNKPCRMIDINYGEKEIDMDKTFRLLRMALVCGALLTLLAVGASAAGVKKSDWAAESIDKANRSGILTQAQHLGDYTAPITRLEIAELIAKAYENVTEEPYFADAAPFTDASSTAVATVYDLGIMNGKGEETFDPRDYATREEMAKIILSFKAASEGKSLELPEQYPRNFSDFDQISDWAKPYVAKASNEGIINGYEDGRFGGSDTVSREMAIALVTRTVYLNEGEKPVITSLEWDSIVPSDAAFDVYLAEEGTYRLIAQQINGYGGRFGSIASCGNDNIINVTSGRLSPDSLYYIFAERDGVFSDPVRVYTDRYNLFIDMEFYAEAGPVTVAWNRVPGVEVYYVNVTEKRNSRYPEDIPPKETRTYEIRWEDYYTFNTNPNRIYTVEIVGGDYTATEDIQILSVDNDGAEEIYANYPQSKAEADALMKTITVPVWKLRNGQKVASTASLTVHYAIAERVKLVFEEIYNGPEKFPIKDVGAYAWRGGTTEHNGGTAIDINSNENYCLYNDGTKIGSHWKPYEDPYSITPYGDVITAFEKYGFTWGGDAWSNPKDYMHFSYLGT